MSLTFTSVKRHPVLVGGTRWGTTDITLDASYAAGGWTITAANLNLNGIYNIYPPGCKSGYVFEWNQVASKLKAYKVSESGAAGSMSALFGGAWAIDGDDLGCGIVGSVSGTTAANAYARVYDASAGVADRYQNLATVKTDLPAGGYAVNLQLFPDAPANTDAAYFGNATKFCEVFFNVSATAGSYTGTTAAGVWEYWNGTAWATLTTYGNQHDKAYGGGLPFAQDGAHFFLPPADWATTAVPGTLGYWIRFRITDATQITTVAILSINHQIVAPSDPYKIATTTTITRAQGTDGKLVGQDDIFTLRVPKTWGIDIDAALTNGGNIVGGGAAANALGATYSWVYDASEVVKYTTCNAGDGAARAVKGCLPTAPANTDAMLIGHTVQMFEFGFDVSATVGVYTPAPAGKWQYWNGAWTDLTVINDGTGNAVLTGTQPWARDGSICFKPVTDWVANQPDASMPLAYWVQFVVVDATKITTAAVLTNLPYYIFPQYRTFAPKSGLCNKIRLTHSGTTNATAAIKFYIMAVNANGTSVLPLTAELTYPQSTSGTYEWSYAPGAELPIYKGYSYYVVCTQEDGTNEIANANIELSLDLSALHTAADVKFFIMNFTKGTNTASLTWAQDLRQESWSGLTLACDDGDSIGVVVVQEDGVSEIENGLLTFTAGEAAAGALMECAASEAGLNGLVLRCDYKGR